MNTSEIPAPGFEKLIVVPIPTPDTVPKPIASFGSKYISLLSLLEENPLKPASTVNFLSRFSILVVAV